MSLGTKISFILVMFFLFSGALYFGVQRLVIFPSFLAIEHEAAQKNSRRVSQAIRREVQHLDSLVHDWAAWDETYTFMADFSHAYIDANLPDTSFIDNRMNLIYFVSPDGRVVWGKVMDLNAAKEILLPRFPKGKFPDSGAFTTFYAQGDDLSQVSLSGIFMTKQGPMILAARPVLTNENQGPVRGTVIMGRFLDAGLIRILRDQTEVDFDIRPADAGTAQGISRDASGQALVIHEIYPDIEGQPGIVIRSETARTISARGAATLKTALVSILLAGAGATLLVLLFLNWAVFAPVKKLIRRAEEAGGPKNKTGPERPWQVNEIDLLSQTLETMVKHQQARAEALKRMNARLKQDMILLKQAEAEKIKAHETAANQRKMALAGQIAGKMAHDFNNVLGVIMGNAELMLMDCRDPEVQKSLELILAQTARGKNLTRNLVAFAKDQALNPRYFSLNETVENVLGLMTHETGAISVVPEMDRELPDVYADRGMIEHSLVNLLQNAVHSLGRTESPRIVIRTFARPGQTCFEIRDNGCGIPGRFLEKVFEPAFTLKGSKDTPGHYLDGIKGAGYGLTNVKKYIDAHQGNIRIRSAPGTGTGVIVCLPKVGKKPCLDDPSFSDSARRPSRKHILVVEDDSDISAIQYRVLSRPPLRHRVDTAPDAETAETLLAGNRYDLVSLDYVLAGSGSGMAVYRHIRKSDKTLPVLFISGNIEFLESVKALKAKDPFVNHLPKPCPNDLYLDTVSRMLQNRRPD